MPRARRLKSKPGPPELTQDSRPAIDAMVTGFASTLGARAARKYFADCARAGILDPPPLTDAQLQARLTDALFSLAAPAPRRKRR
jgi:hypothetical protein